MFITGSHRQREWNKRGHAGITFVIIIMIRIIIIIVLIILFVVVVVVIDCDIAVPKLLEENKSVLGCIKESGARQG